MTHVDPTPPRRGTRRAGRRKTLALEAAARVIAEKGAEGARFVDVAETSGVPVSTLQYYFGSREDLIVAAFRHASRSEIAAIEAAVAGLDDPWARLVHVVDAALAGYESVPVKTGQLWIEAWRFATRDAEMRDDVLADYAAWRRLVAAAVEAGIADGTFTTGVPPERVAIVTLALLDGVGLPLALDDPAISSREARRSVLATLGTILGRDGEATTVSTAVRKRRNGKAPSTPTPR